MGPLWDIISHKEEHMALGTGANLAKLEICHEPSAIYYKLSKKRGNKKGFQRWEAAATQLASVC
jgi:hypothetical protein